MSSDTPRLVRKPEALRMLGLGNTAFHDLVRSGDIAPPVRLTKRAVAWRESDLINWINTRPIAARRGK